MADNFVPFLSSVRSKLSGSASGFTPSAVAAPGAVAEKPSSSAGHGEVKVELIREGERVSRVRIECRCGEIIELDCEY